jgi:hypothetical protein
MKIKKITLTEKDKLKAYKTAVRNSIVETGMDKQLVARVHRNKKKYTRKGFNINKIKNNSQES